ncbi:MAG: hypothetical protein ABJZ55_22925 [Fuerstiella sp.]
MATTAVVEADVLSSRIGLFNKKSLPTNDSLAGFDVLQAELNGLSKLRCRSSARMVLGPSGIWPEWYLAKAFLKSDSVHD